MSTGYKQMSELDEIYNLEEEYEEEAIPRIPEVKKEHRSYIGETINSVERYLDWDNLTFFKDRDALYSLGTELYKKDLGSTLAGILLWAKEKQPHIRALLKVIRPKL